MPTTAERTACRSTGISVEVWLAYLADGPLRERDGRTLVAGQPLTETQSRALYRWRHERTTPSVWTVDAFLCSFGIPLSDFFLWAETHDLTPWASGRAPDFWDAEPSDMRSHRALRSRDRGRR